MAYTTKKTFSTGAVLTAADMNTYVSDNVDWNHELIKAWEGGVPAARVSCSTSFEVAGSATTAIVFDTEVLDTDGIWEVAAPTKLTCKTAGVYLITGNVKFAQAQNIIIEVNGNAVAYYSDTSTETPKTITTIYPLAVNDYAELFVKNAAGTAQNVMYVEGVSPVFSMVYLGPSA